MEKVIVVGAGLSGATISRLFAEDGYDVTVLDKRDSIGGNLFDYVNKDGIRVQPYGRRVFHTNDDLVFEFLSCFTEWYKYEHKVLARVRKDKLVPVPFNLNSLYALFPQKTAEMIEEVLRSEMGDEQEVPIMKLKNHASKDIRKFADYVYKNIFYIYTMKQWGFKPEHLGEDVMNRVPVRISRDDRACSDKYQFMPKDGFTAMITNLLRHPRIQLKLKTDAKKVLSFKDGEIFLNGKKFDGQVIYTGSVDELFNYKLGVLPYRSLKLKFKKMKCSSYQRAAVVNYTTSHKYTKTTEFSKFTCEPKDTTLVAREYPVAYKKNKNNPYYPIPIKKNIELYEEYVKMASEYKNLHLLGRLATYKYMNMDKAVRSAMELYNKITFTKVDEEFISEISKGVL
jgi:UDP-galactopyranose mutase